METLLTIEWLPDADAVQIRDDASLTTARDRVREIANEAGVESEVAARAALVATELARNQLRHAHRGRMTVQPIERVGEAGLHRGLEIIAADEGAGITDVRRALEGVARG